MHIAFISYEYPPETPNGGIATYVQQAARMLAMRDHVVEVFAGSLTRSAVVEDGEIRVHRVFVAQRSDFAVTVAPVFVQRHQAVPFDVMEGPDYDADARFAVEQAPDVPLVVRLHTPRYLAAILNTPEDEEKHGSGDRRQGTGEKSLSTINYQLSTPPPSLFDYAYQHVRRADVITAPSRAIRDIVARDWQLTAEQIYVYPNVYQPSPVLLQLPPLPHSRIVTYFGRLEQRKGVITLAKAVPAVLRHLPDVKFRFVGRTLESPEPNLNMRAYLERLLAPYADSVTISGHISQEAIPALLADTEICAFPSRWENFPGVCLEAMAAGRAIIGSEAGGMSDMLQEEAGFLIPPESPQRLAQAIVELLTDTERSEQMAQQARQRVQALYGIDSVAPLQEASYAAAIQHKKAKPFLP